MVASDAVWRRLASGRTLEGLGLARVGERWDLRGIGAPLLPWSRKDPNPTFRGVRFWDLDLSGSTLHHFRFFNCSIANVVGDESDWFDSRLWGTKVADSSFRAAKLVSVGMGGDRRAPNVWEDVDFSQADMRQSSHFAETYSRCNFSGAQLNRVSFEGSRHEGSLFAGDIEEIEFRALPKGVTRARQANAMRGVDFTAAKIRFGSFHKIDLSGCKLPSSPDHLIFENRGHLAASALQDSRIRSSAMVSLRVMMEIHVRDALPGGGGPGFQHRCDLGETAQEVEEAVAFLRIRGAH